MRTHREKSSFQEVESVSSNSDGHNYMPVQGDTTEDGKVSEDEPVPPSIKAYIDKQVQNSKEPDDRSPKKKWRNSWRSASPITKGTFMLTSAVAIATVAYSIIAGFQLSEMRHTNSLTQQALDDSGKTLTQTLAKMQLQIDAADTANKNFLDSERPWLGGSTQIEHFEIGGQAASYIVFNNTGKKPAKILDLNIQSGCYARFPTNPESQFARGGVHGTFITTPGGVLFTAHRPLFGSEANPVNPLLTEKNFASFNSGSCPLYIFGKVEYQDVYGGTKWWTHVCVQYVPPHHAGEAGGFAACKEYNDAR